MDGEVFLYHPVVDSFVPGSLSTVCKKQVNLERSEAQTYEALMDDPLSEVIPKFYREFQQNDDGMLVLILSFFCTAKCLEIHYYPSCRLCRLAWVGCLCLFVCLSVCPQHNSKTNDPKVLKLDIWNHLVIS